MARGERKEVKG